MFYTFYSFKGGVGRSMALANIAQLLYRRGLKVLVVDFDLEAPGLERFLSPTEDLSEQRGVIDMVVSYKTLRELLPKSDVKDVSTSAVGFRHKVEPLKNFIITIDENDAGGALYMILAGKRPRNNYTTYTEQVRTFDWDEFYTEWDGEEFFDWFRKEAATIADIVLVDSRTGVTEMSGICTYHLADILVMFTAPNQQNLEGIKLIASRLEKRRKAMTEKSRQEQVHTVDMLMVPSRVERGESDALKDFKGKFFATLGDYNSPKLKLTDAFDDLMIPYVQRYAFFEKLAANEPDQPVAKDLMEPYQRIVSAMVSLAPVNSRFYKRYFRLESKNNLLAPGLWKPEPDTNFTGREWVFKAIDDWLISGTQNWFTILSDPGSGKTSLAFRLVQISQGEVESVNTQQVGPELLTYAHFCQPLQPTSLDPVLFASWLSEALSARYPSFAAELVKQTTPEFNITIRQDINSMVSGGTITGVSITNIDATRIDARAAFANLVLWPLRKLCTPDFKEKVVILVDGLDMSLFYSGKDSIAEVLSEQLLLPEQIRFIFTSRLNPQLEPFYSLSTTLNFANSPENISDVKNYAKRRLESVTDLSFTQQNQIIEKIITTSEGNFLLAASIVNEAITNPEKVKDLNLGQLPQGLISYYMENMRREIGADKERWEKHDSLLLAVLAVSYEPLNEKQLAGILNISLKEVQKKLVPWRQYLHLNEGNYQLYHRTFGDFIIHNDEYPTSGGIAHAKTGEYFLSRYKDSWQSSDEYALRNTPTHLHEAIGHVDDKLFDTKLQEELAALLTDSDFLMVKEKRIGLQDALKDFELVPKTSKILTALGLTLARNGILDEAAKSYEQSLACAQEEHDLYAISEITVYLGQTYADIGDLEKAENYLRSSIPLLESVKNLLGEAMAFGTLGTVSQKKSDIREAIEAYQHAIKIAETIDDQVTKGIWLSNLGRAYLESGQLESSLRAYQTALAIAIELKDEAKQAFLLNNLGIIRHNLGLFEEAISVYKKAISLFKLLGDSLNESATLNNLGLTYKQMGKYNDAISIFQTALAEAESHGRQETIGNLLGNLGNVHEEMGQEVEAIELHEHALMISRETGNKHSEISDLVNLARVYGKIGRKEVAEEFRLKALTISRELGEVRTRYFSQGYALIIGVGGDIVSSIADVQGVAEMLRDPERGAYPIDQVTLLTGEKATKQAILEGLEDLIKKTNTESTVLIYFSGHGYIIHSPLGNFNYLLPSSYDPKQLAETAIRGDELDELLTELPAGHVLFLSDFCHPGGLENGESYNFDFQRSPIPVSDRSMKRLLNLGKVSFITATEGKEIAFAGKPYSAFGLAVLEALSGKGVSEMDSFLRIGDLQTTIRKILAEKTQEYQRPGIQIKSKENFPIAFYAGGEKRPKEPIFRTEDVQIEPKAGDFFIKVDKIPSEILRQEKKIGFTQGYALVIGTGTNMHTPIYNVPAAAADAKAVAQVLQDSNMCGYPAEQVISLVGAQASRSSILSAIENITHQVNAADTVLFFYSGQGAYGTDGNHYLVCHDTEISQGRVVPNTGVSDFELLHRFKAVAAKRVLIIFNTCFGKNISLNLEIEKETIETSGLPESTSMAFLATGQGRIVITSNRENQKIFRSPGRLSIFTQALVDGLLGKGVASRDGFISAFSLYEYIYETVSETVKKQYNAVQEPELVVMKGVAPFAVALYKGSRGNDFTGTNQPVPDLPAVKLVSTEKAQRILSSQTINSRPVEQGYQNINTGEGKFIKGDITIRGGDFIVGDKVSIGDIVSGSGIAIGRGARAEVNITGRMSNEEIKTLFAPLYREVDAVNSKARSKAKMMIQGLEDDVLKGKQGSDESRAKLIDGLVELVPGTVSMIFSIFATPVLVEQVGPVTKFVLEKLQRG